MWQTGRRHKALLLHTKGWWPPQGIALVQLSQLWTKWHFSHGTSFVLRGTTNKIYYSHWGIVQTFSWKWSKQVSHFKDNWWYLLPIRIKFRVPSKHKNFRQPVFTSNYDLDRFWIFKVFSDEFGAISPNTIFMSHNEMSQYLKDSHVINVWFYKVIPRVKDPFKMPDRPMGFKEIEYLEFQMSHCN